MIKALAGLRRFDVRKFFAPSTTDFVAVAFPKVGNTWLRFSLGRYIKIRHAIADDVLLDNGDVEILKQQRAFASGYFTHQPLEWDNQTADDLSHENVTLPHDGGRVLLLVRHPLDALVSLYMHEAYRVRPRRLFGTPADMVDNPVFGLSKFLRFYQLWDEHIGRSGAENVLVWRYEDAKHDPRKQLHRIVEWLGDDVDHKALSEAVAYGSFDNMKQMEITKQSPAYRSSGFKVFGNSDPATPDSMHIREGSSGGWRQHFPASMHAELECRVREGMPKQFGYSSLTSS
ncbi:hypothetical protein XM25_07755 [Devosia sp. H5989]|nr:hypothetical protein XM25_07755 [Devosia sp. H5989]